MIAQTHYTITDLNDPILQGTAPENPVTDMLWLDTSVSPNVLKRWDGTAWQIISDPDSIQIGGRNLLLKGDSVKTATVPSGSTDGYTDRYYLSEYGKALVVEDTEFVLSLNYEINTETTTQGQLYAQINSLMTRPIEYIVEDVTTAPSSGRSVIRIKVTAEQAGNTSVPNIRFRMRYANEGASYRVWNVKLEKGNKATDWTAAPEDTEDHLQLELASVRAQTTTLADSIQSEVRSTYALKSDMTQVAQEVSTLATQTSENYTWSVNRINQLQADVDANQASVESDLDTIKTYMQFGQDGLSIGKSNSAFTVNLDNEKLSFKDGSKTEVAYLSNKKLYINQAEILATLDIGKFAFEPQSNGHLSLLFKGQVPIWSTIQMNVRAGKAPLLYAIGDEFTTTYTNNGTVYEMPWIVVAHREVEWADGSKHPGLVLQSKYATIEWIQFDAPEENIVNLTEEPNALDGWYYWGKTGTAYTKLTVSTGGALPTTYDNIVKSSIDNVNVVQYGYNRWSHSAFRQWLNSDADAGHWWTAQHPGDKEPTQHATRDGFIKGLDSDFLACINPIKVNTACNTVTDGGVTDTTVDKFFLPSIEEIYGVPQAAGVEGDYWPYWKTITGLTEPSNAANDARKIPALNDKTGAAVNQRLRSANRGYLSNVWAASTGGSLVGSYAASGAYRACPACVIS